MKKVWLWVERVGMAYLAGICIMCINDGSHIPSATAGLIISIILIILRSRKEREE